MGVGRRAVLQGLAAAATIPPCVEATTRPSAKAAAHRKIVIKGGYVASLDKSVGDLPVGDVLIDGASIAADFHIDVFMCRERLHRCGPARKFLFQFAGVHARPDQPPDVVEHDLRIRERTCKVRDVVKLRVKDQAIE